MRRLEPVVVRRLADWIADRGNVRNEVPTFKADVQAENAYLVRPFSTPSPSSTDASAPQLDSNRVVNDWLKVQGWGIIDVSIIPQPSVDRTLQTVALVRRVFWLHSQQAQTPRRCTEHQGRPEEVDEADVDVDLGQLHRVRHGPRVDSGDR